MTAHVHFTFNGNIRKEILVNWVVAARSFVEHKISVSDFMLETAKAGCSRYENLCVVSMPEEKRKELFDEGVATTLDIMRVTASPNAESLARTLATASTGLLARCPDVGLMGVRDAEILLEDIIDTAQRRYPEFVLG